MKRNYMHSSPKINISTMCCQACLLNAWITSEDLPIIVPTCVHHVETEGSLMDIWSSVIAHSSLTKRKFFHRTYVVCTRTHSLIDGDISIIKTPIPLRPINNYMEHKLSQSMRQQIFTNIDRKVFLCDFPFSIIKASHGGLL